MSTHGKASRKWFVVQSWENVHCHIMIIHNTIVKILWYFEYIQTVIWWWCHDVNVTDFWFIFKSFSVMKYQFLPMIWQWSLNSAITWIYSSVIINNKSIVIIFSWKQKWAGGFYRDISFRNWRWTNTNGQAFKRASLFLEVLLDVTADWD